MTLNTILSPPPRRDVIKGLLDALKASTARPFAVSDVPPPDAGKVAPTPPYGIIYPINDGSFWGGLGAPENSAEFAFQVTSVGATYEQCEWLSDRVRNTVLGRNDNGVYEYAITMPSPHHINYRESLSGAGNMTRNDLMWSTTESFMLYVCPL